jgi:hypothetical protein
MQTAQTTGHHHPGHRRGLDMVDIEIARMSDAERIGEGMKRGVGRLPPALQEQLKELITPQALAVAGTFFVAWLVSHAVGIGFVVDAIFLAAAAVAIGLAVFTGIDELIQFGTTAIAARSNSEMDRAAAHFATAVSILGVQAIIALFLRRAPQTFRGGRARVGPPPTGAGAVLRPGLRGVRNLPAGAGETSWWGEITISRLGTSTDRRLAALHESVHRALTPKLNILRTVRVEGRRASYTRSSLITYLEEALAESFAQVSVNGAGGLFTGIVFPVRNGYVTLFSKQVNYGVLAAPFVPEIAGLYLGVVNAKGWMWDAYFSPSRPS